jgi:hypothetical protein
VRIGEGAQALGIRVLFLTQPSLHGSDDAWAGREARVLQVEGRTHRISAATERRLLDLYNRELLSLCSGRGWECLDLAALIPPDSLYFYDAVHFNDSGAALAADAIAGYLARR